MAHLTKEAINDFECLHYVVDNSDNTVYNNLTVARQGRKLQQNLNTKLNVDLSLLQNAKFT